MMTSRERLTRCYFQQELDRPAVNCLTLFPQNDPSYDKLKAYVKEKADLKERGLNTELLDTPYPQEKRTEITPEGYQRFITILHTPKGDLTASEVANLPGEPPLPETHFLKTREDAEAYLSLPLPKVEGNIEPFFEADLLLFLRLTVHS